MKTRKGRRGAVTGLVVAQPPLPPVAELERAWRGRDATYDGIFVLGVRTTGIFCRPTCPARKPLARNVEYFITPREALTAGYRPCRRCRPMQVDGEPPWARALVEAVERAPHERITEADLRRRGIDPSTARRYFLKQYGMTFQAFSRARRLGMALHQIREGAPLDNVVFDSGFESHSGFRDAFVRAFGTAPGKARGGGSVTVTWVRTPLGPMIAGATAEGICLLEFTDRRMLEAQLKTVQRRFGAPVASHKNKLLEQLEIELARYFEGNLERFSVPLVYPGTEFQRKVWSALLKIPYGETRSYEDLALAVSSPGAQRAVGRANGMNRIAIVIPCHRVVNKDGRLGGYGGGLRRKEFLLRLEREHRKGGPNRRRAEGPACARPRRQTELFDP